MTDIVDKKTRSKMMSRIRGKDTKPEMVVRRYLHSEGFRYRLHDKKLPGKPDLVFKKYKAVIFINGCFWHRHKNCHFATTPSTNSSFWQKKFDQTQQRDARNIKKLHALGWKTINTWECALRGEKKEHSLNLIINAISNSSLDHIDIE